MAVIELAKPGLEATTYELIVTVGNAALTLNGIIATQLLTPMKAVGCDDDTGNCSPNTVDVTGKSGFDSTDGPNRFTNYTLVLTAISLTACYLFTRFLPASKEECHLWRLKGEEQGDSAIRGRLAFGMAVLIVGVSVIVSHFSFSAIVRVLISFFFVFFSVSCSTVSLLQFCFSMWTPLVSLRLAGLDAEEN